MLLMLMLHESRNHESQCTLLLIACLYQYTLENRICITTFLKCNMYTLSHVNNTNFNLFSTINNTSQQTIFFIFCVINFSIITIKYILYNYIISLNAWNCIINCGSFAQLVSMPRGDYNTVYREIRYIKASHWSIISRHSMQKFIHDGVYCNYPTSYLLIQTMHI
jgi:hypothetical protein